MTKKLLIGLSLISIIETGTVNATMHRSQNMDASSLMIQSAGTLDKSDKEKLFAILTPLEQGRNKKITAEETFERHKINHMLESYFKKCRVNFSKFLSPDDIKVFCKAVNSGLFKNSKYICLDFGGISQGNEDAVVKSIEAIGFVLRLGNSSHMSRISNLSVQMCNSVKVSRAISSELLSSGSLNLQTLSILNSGLDRSEINLPILTAIGSQTFPKQRLITLDFTNSRLSNDGALYLARTLGNQPFPALNSLIFYGCYLEDSGALAIARIFSQQTTPIKELNLFNPRGGMTNIIHDKDGVRSILQKSHPNAKVIFGWDINGVYCD